MGNEIKIYRPAASTGTQNYSVTGNTNLWQNQNGNTNATLSLFGANPVAGTTPASQTSGDSDLISVTYVNGNRVERRKASPNDYENGVKVSQTVTTYTLGGTPKSVVHYLVNGDIVSHSYEGAYLIKNTQKADGTTVIRKYPSGEELQDGKKIKYKEETKDASGKTTVKTTAFDNGDSISADYTTRTTTTIEGGEKRTSTKDEKGREIKKTWPQGASQFKYDEEGNLVEEKEYHNGRLSTVSIFKKGDNPWDPSQKIHYYESGAKMIETRIAGGTEYVDKDRNGKITQIRVESKDSQGRVVKEVTKDSEGKVTNVITNAYRRDSHDLVSSTEKDGEGKLLRKTRYNTANGNPVSEIRYHADESTTEITYNPNQFLAEKSSVTKDKEGNIIETSECTYDRKGHLLSKITKDKDGNVIETEEHTYNAQGKETSHTVRGERFNFASQTMYDARGREAKIIYKDKDGNIESTTTITYSGKQRIEETRNGEGKLLGIYKRDDKGSTEELYDNDGNVIASCTYNSRTEESVYKNGKGEVITFHEWNDIELSIKYAKKKEPEVQEERPEDVQENVKEDIQEEELQEAA